MIYTKLPRVDFSAVIIICTTTTGHFPIFRKKMDHPFYPGLWGFPAGKLEKNESLLQGAEREVLEETGNNVTGYIVPLNLKPSPTIHHNRHTHEPIFFFAHSFFCKRPLGNIILNPDEHQDCAFASAQDLLADKYNLIPDALDDFEKALKKIAKLA